MPTRTRHRHLRSTACTRARSRRRRVYEFAETADDMSPRLRYHAEQRPRPRHPARCAPHPPCAGPGDPLFCCLQEAPVGAARCGGLSRRATCISRSRVRLRDPTARLFSAAKGVSLSGWGAVDPSHAERRLGCFPGFAIMDRAAGFYVDTSFQLTSINTNNDGCRDRQSEFHTIFTCHEILL